MGGDRRGTRGMKRAAYTRFLILELFNLSVLWYVEVWAYPFPISSFCLARIWFPAQNISKRPSRVRGPALRRSLPCLASPHHSFSCQQRSLSATARPASACDLRHFSRNMQVEVRPRSIRLLPSAHGWNVGHHLICLTCFMVSVLEKGKSTMRLHHDDFGPRSSRVQLSATWISFPRCVVITS